MKWVLDHLRISWRKVLYIAPNKALVFHFIRWLLAFAHADRDSSSRYLSRLLVLYEPYDQVKVPVINGNQILFESATVGLEPCQVKVLDEAHCIFCAGTDPLIQDRLKSYSARSTVLLSDLSQGSSTIVSFDRHYPNRHSVKLMEVVRSTQRIVAGALSFRLGESRAENVHSLGTQGPPIKTFLFEVQTGQDKMEEYAKHITAAISYVIYHFPSINLHNRMALLVKDSDLLESLNEKLRRQLQRDFSKRYSLVSCEKSLGFLPGHLSAERFAQDSPQAAQNIILDAISNARGLEHLIVISIGLDAPIQGGERWHHKVFVIPRDYKGTAGVDSRKRIHARWMAGIPGLFEAEAGNLRQKGSLCRDSQRCSRCHAQSEGQSTGGALDLTIMLRLSRAPPQDQLERITTITSIH